MITTPVETVYKRPSTFTDVPTHYCPGCTHGVAHRLVAEVLEEMNLQSKTIGVASVGCSVFAYNYFDCDFVEAAHGRAPAPCPEKRQGFSTGYLPISLYSAEPSYTGIVFGRTCGFCSSTGVHTCSSKMLPSVQS